MPRTRFKAHFLMGFSKFLGTRRGQQVGPVALDGVWSPGFGA